MTEKILDRSVIFGLLGAPVGCVAISVLSPSTGAGFALLGAPMLAALAVFAGALRLSIFIFIKLKTHLRHRKKRYLEKTGG
jgi:hypothetical protein